MNPTSVPLFNSQTPFAPAGYQNGKWQTDGGVPVQEITVNVPWTGGAVAKTASYNAAAADCGQVIAFNSSSAVTYLLLNPPPFAQWCVFVQNNGTGTLTVSPNVLTLNGSTAGLTLSTGQGAYLATDGTNYVAFSTGASASIPLTIGFPVGSGAPGVDVGPMIPAAHAGALSSCVVVVKASDPAVGLALTINKNGTSIFSVNPTVAAGTPSGTLVTAGTLTANPLSVAKNDIFTIDITAGSSAWQFTAQLT